MFERKNTYLCPKCLNSRRINWRQINDTLKGFKCQHCGTELINIYDIARIPKKSNKSAWNKFFKYLTFRFPWLNFQKK